ncbi:unnamed protein product [Moneuplotes crassus]|uniref:Uncharacterized protein n=1 Tax=Euplotes crassus TaxID=5936 RepID=A0AAD2DAJ7_EUPCR|nr:unnamed protein product [Moneuplotes crassus]
MSHKSCAQNECCLSHITYSVRGRVCRCYRLGTLSQGPKLAGLLQRQASSAPGQCCTLNPRRFCTNPSCKSLERRPRAMGEISLKMI